MSESVADALWSMLASAGVKRCYGIVGDALNPVIDALRRDGRVEFIQVRNEEAGVFAAVAEASLTGNLVAVCGTSGPGVMHLLNGLIDAQREGVPVIAIAGDTVSGLIDSGTIEEINPYTTFQIASLYTGRLVNPAQTRTVVQTAIRTALSEHGPTVIAVPGDVATGKVPDDSYQAVTHNPPLLRPSDEDLRRLAEMIDAAGSVTIFGGDGCRDAHDEVVALAEKLQAPVGYAYRGKQWLEWGNPNAVGMTGLLGWGGAYEAMQHCDLCLLLGTNFPLSDFYPKKPKKVQVDLRPSNIGRRTHIDMGLVGDIKDTVAALLPLVAQKHETHHLSRALKTTEEWRKNMSHYVTRGPELTPIRPEYLVSTLDELAADDAVVCADTGTAVHLDGALHHRQGEAQHLRLVLMGVDGERDAEHDRSRACLPGPSGDRDLRRRRPVDADGRPAHDRRAPAPRQTRRARQQRLPIRAHRASKRPESSRTGSSSPIRIWPRSPRRSASPASGSKTPETSETPSPSSLQRQGRACWTRSSNPTPSASHPMSHLARPRGSR